MTQAGEKLYGDWESRPPPLPPGKPYNLVWWIAMAVVVTFLVVNVVRGIATGHWNW